VRTAFALFLLAVLASKISARDPELIGARVKSASWRILRKPHQVEIFEGDVRYIKSDRVLSADRARYDHERGLFEAEGNVRARQLLRDGSWLEAAGKTARHDENSGNGWMRGAERVDLARTPPDGGTPGTGRARLISWSLREERLLLEGEVALNDPRGTLRAERAEYLHAARLWTFTGRRPVLTGREPSWASAVQADSITARDLGGGRRKVTGDGRARGWIFFDGPDRRRYH